MAKLIDLTGQRFGRLTVIKREENRNKLPVWLCKCDCGTEIRVLGCNLRTNHTRSCGCVRKEITAERSIKHGMSRNRLFNVWSTMRQRCANPNNRKYKDYGGRGIMVCQEWRDSFQAFYDYVSLLPHFDEKGYSLDRIDNDGNYEPDNVRWASDEEQANNRRRRKIREAI